MIRLALPLAGFLVLCLAPAPVFAAEITEVADAADGDDPFDVEIELGWSLSRQDTKITRENLQTDNETGRDEFVDVTELKYQKVTSQLTPTLRIGLYKDLELHFIQPIVIIEAQEWGPDPEISTLPANSTIHNRFPGDGETVGICPNGTLSAGCAGPIFPFTDDSGANNSYRAGIADPTVGFAWGILNDERDRWSPTWVVGVDYTFPLAERRDPTAVSHTSSNAAALGEKTNYWKFHTALSRRVGGAEPFVKFHYTLPYATRSAYHNCDNPGALADLDQDEPGVQTTCNLPQGTEDVWSERGDNRGGYRPSHVGGFLVGSEFLPYVDPSRYLRIAFQLSGGVEYHSEGRNYSELSDALGKLTYTDEYVSLTANAGIRAQLSRYARFHLLGTYAYATDHLITNESIGTDLDHTGLVELMANTVNPERNPNFDFRYDQSGRRFRAEENHTFGFFVMGELDF